MFYRYTLRGYYSKIYKSPKTPNSPAMKLPSTGAVRYPASLDEPALPLPLPEPEDEFPLIPLTLQVSSQSAFHVPLEVKLFSPVKLSTLVLLFQDHPLLTACPLSVTLDTWPETPSTVTFPSELVSAKLPEVWAVTE